MPNTRGPFRCTHRSNSAPGLGRLSAPASACRISVWRGRFWLATVTPPLTRPLSRPRAPGAERRARKRRAAQRIEILPPPLRAGPHPHEIAAGRVRREAGRDADAEDAALDRVGDAVPKHQHALRGRLAIDRERPRCPRLEERHSHEPDPVFAVRLARVLRREPRAPPEEMR